jgi:hypothetical protein
VTSERGEPPARRDLGPLEALPRRVQVECGLGEPGGLGCAPRLARLRVRYIEPIKDKTK